MIVEGAILGLSLASLYILLVPFFCILGLYFLPVILADKNKHTDTTAIFVLNFFLGWTILGWFVALIWAYTDPKKTIRREHAKIKKGG